MGNSPGLCSNAQKCGKWCSKAGCSREHLGGAEEPRDGRSDVTEGGPRGGAAGGPEILGVLPVRAPGVAVGSKVLPDDGELVARAESNGYGIGGGVSSRPSSGLGSSGSRVATLGQRVRAEEAVAVSLPDGSTYTGQLRDGQRHGQGSSSSHAETYAGGWKDDNRHGAGRLTWCDGRVYEGQFHGGKFSGRGHMCWQTKAGPLVYDGQYMDDQKHGAGKLRWPDGRTYDGEWCCGKRHGEGVYINAQGDQKTGLWLEDRFTRWLTSPERGGLARADKRDQPLMQI